MKLNTPAFGLLFAVITIISCKKDSPSGNSNPKTTNQPDTTKTVTTPPSLPTDADVYFAGTVASTNDISTYEACYWKNDTLTRLTNSSSTATGILINDKNLYITGYTEYGSGERAALWKNGVPVTLSGSSTTSGATGIAVNNNNDILISGFTLDRNGSGQATYWINGIPNIIEPSNLFVSTEADAIAVNGSDIYMAGFSFDSRLKTETATLWKNGVPTTLGGTVSKACGVAADGSDVYVVGVVNGVATLWKNGISTTLDSTPHDNSTALCIVINGSDVYVAGFVNGSPAYWKNGIQIILPDALTTPVSAIGIAVRGSDFYIASGANSVGNSIFWIDGKSAPLMNGLTTVNAVAIVPH